MITDSDDDDEDDEDYDSNNTNWFSNSAFLIEWLSVSINHHSLEKKVQNLVAS